MAVTKLSEAYNRRLGQTGKETTADDAVGLIDSALAEGNVEPDEIPSLSLIKILLRRGGSPAACKWIVDQAVSAKVDANNPKDVVTQVLFPRPYLNGQANDQPADVKNALDKIRTGLFDAEPIVVLRGLIRWCAKVSKVPSGVSITAVKFAARLLDDLCNSSTGALDFDDPELFPRTVTAVYGKLTEAALQKFKPYFVSAVEVVKTLRSLCRIVQEPEDILLLYDKKYYFIRTIAITPLRTFKRKLLEPSRGLKDVLSEVDEGRIEEIHSAALRIDCWNEHVWMDAMDAYREEFIPLEPPGLGVSSTAITKNALPAGKQDVSRNNLTDIFLLEDPACETCSSITSPSAYFADLMSLLKRSPSGKNDSKTVLDVLCDRRPDLLYLDLTCANAQTKIPYISLVNEALESYVRCRADGRGTSIISYNTPKEAVVCNGDADAVPAYDTGNTIEWVYTGPLSRQLYPFSVFPYNKARDEASQILSGFYLSPLQLVETFHDRELLLRDIPSLHWREASPVREQVMAGVAEVFARHDAAERLGMRQEDFAAITGETYFVGWFADLLQGLSKPGHPVKAQSVVEWTAAQLWGYPDSKTMTDTAGELGLSFIKRQLMHRSGLSFQDVLDLVKAQTFNQDLVIVNKDGTGEFGNSIEGLRLLASASKPPFTALTDEICWRLQSFIRLKTKLKWSTKDLDAAVYDLRELELRLMPAGSPPTASGASAFFTVTPFVIKSLAAIVKLVDLCKNNDTSSITPVELLPLWGPINSFGDNSLLYTRFLTPALQRLSTAFNRPKNSDQEYFQDEGGGYHTLDESELAICTGLKWPLQHFAALRKASGFSDGTSSLTLDNLSRLYRHALLCQMLSIAPSDCSRLYDLFFGAHGHTTPFESPEATLAAVGKWKRLFVAGWTLDDLCLVLGASTAETNDGDGFRVLMALRQGYRDMKNSFPFLSAAATATEADVRDCAAKAFDSATAKVVSEFVLGTQKKTDRIQFASAEALNSALASTKNWPDILKLVPDFSDGAAAAEVQLLGIFSREDRKIISALTIGDATLKQAVTTVCEQALFPQGLITKRFSVGATNPEAKQALESLVPTLDATKEAAGVERWAAFIHLAAPTIVKELLENLICNTVMAFFPNVDHNLGRVLLSSIVHVVPGVTEEETVSAMTALQNLSRENPLSTTENMDAYFTPNASGTYTFALANDTEQLPTLTINGITLPQDGNKKTWMGIPLLGGRRYRLTSSDTAPSKLCWATTTSMKSPFTSDMLLPADKVHRAKMVMGATRRVVKMCEMAKLASDEVQSLSLSESSPGAQNILRIDFANPTITHLVLLQQYADIKKFCNQSKRAANSPKEKTSLISLFEWLSQMTFAEMRDVASQISAATGWDKQRVDEILRCKYEDSRADDVTDGQITMMTCLQRFDGIVGLKSIMEVDARLRKAAAGAGNPESLPPINTLTSLAQPKFTLSGQDHIESNAARTLRARLTRAQASAADGHLMVKRRDALVAFLLQQDYVREQGITSADGLLQYFLVDVQMGPQLQTSRIKQATAVVQLFAQRCILGLEEGVSKTSIVREQWEWRQQYSLWEAHVKLFLYPENWLEPTLRDDKSQLFDEFEASLMKKDLSLATFSQAVKAYVYGLNDVSSLDVVAYLHEPTSATNSVDRFHFFGCTRASPRVFHHRTVSIQRSVRTDENGNEVVNVDNVVWRPWTKIDMDIPVMETEWEGERLEVPGSHLIPVYSGGRIFLFMPQVTSRTIKNTSKDAFKDDQKFGDLATTTSSLTKPLQAWEVTMAWTELVGTNWSPKRVAAQSMLITNDLERGSRLPRANKLHFQPAYEVSANVSSIITIMVGYTSSDGDTVYSSSGGFRFCEDQIRALSDTVDIEFKLTQRPSMLDKNVRVVFDNAFQQVKLDKGVTKFSLEKFAAAYGPEGAERNRTMPLLWVPHALKEADEAVRKIGLSKLASSSVTWTVSYREKGAPTGLVLSSQRLNGTSVSYFALPKWNIKSVEAERKLNKRDAMFDVVDMDHTFSHELMEAVAGKADPIQALLRVISKRGADDPSSVLGAIWDTAEDKTVKNYHELARPAALYNWEVCVHTVMLAMDRFFATQQFNESLEVARLVFDPTSGGRSEGSSSCWKFPPFRWVAQQIQEKSGSGRGQNGFKVSSVASDPDFNLSIMERLSHGALVHATARGRPEAYMKWIVMKYAQALTAAGDVHFQRGTLESLPLAIQRYIEASQILGPEPAQIPRLARRKKPRNFATLANEDEKLDLGLPFSRTLMRAEPGKPAMDEDKRREALACFLRTTYFCVPLNPKFRELRNTVSQRLHNIRNSLDIRGNPVTYALVEPPIDPGALIALSGQGGSMMDTIAMLTGGGEQDSPLPRQRFEFLLQRSMDLCHELRSLGERLLVAIEKKEGETFASLRARHTTAIHKMTLEIKRIQLREAEATIESLAQNRAAQESQLGFFLDLIGEPRTRIPSPKNKWVDIDQDIDAPTQDDLRMSLYEKMELTQADAASALNFVAAGIDGLIAPLCAIPEMQANTAPMGVGASLTVGGRAISMGVSAGSAYIKMLGMMASDEGARAARKAQLLRQLQDRRMQANVRGREIKSLDKQIEIQRLRVQAAQREIGLQEAELAEANQVEEWYRTKFSNAQLYAWMEKSLRGLYYQAYTLALATARRAESALGFEQGRSLSVLRGANYYFDARHDGLLAADYLFLDLKRLEAAYHETRAHDFEMHKTVSLRRIDPLALLELRLTGSCDFSLSESSFDLDFPGHYMRRIRSVAVSIPAVVAPHSGINATLRLTKHRYRVVPTGSASDYAAGEKNRTAFRYDHVPLSAVAISSGNRDTGAFELAFQGAGPRYAPFEGAGVISSWRLELPPSHVMARFDYESISDVLLHIEYTAVDGGAGLRSAAEAAAKEYITKVENDGREQGFWALWDLKNDFVNEWFGFERELQGLAGRENTEKDPLPDSVKMGLGVVKDRLPFWTRQQAKIEIKSVSWVSKSEKLVDGLGMGEDANPVGTEDVVKAALGKSWIKTWKNVKGKDDKKVVVQEGTKWSLSVAGPEKVLAKDGKAPTVYMLFHYVFC